jgi:hypothetical protein
VIDEPKGGPDDVSEDHRRNQAHPRDRGEGGRERPGPEEGTPSGGSPRTGASTPRVRQEAALVAKIIIAIVVVLIVVWVISLILGRRGGRRL